MQNRSAWFQDAPLVIAHRGASLLAPENTMAAFNLAVEVGAHAIELDVKLSRDGEVVIVHDSTLDRTTDGTGTVRSHTVMELRALDAGSYFGESFKGERVPILADVFDSLDGKILINVELTNYATPFDRLPEKVISQIVHRGIESDVLISSFNPVALIKSKRIDPDIPIGLLARGSTRLLINRMMRSRIMYDCYHPAWEHISQGLIEQERRMGKRVHVWTPNSPEEMINLVKAGVNGVITDDPSLARNVLEGL
jgi:glycerophosphoryl diester phosphodiesterase